MVKDSVWSFRITIDGKLHSHSRELSRRATGMKKHLLCLVLASYLHAYPGGASEQLVLATWNAGLRDQPVSALNLTGYAAEINPDILVLNEVKTIEQIQQIRAGLGRDDDFIAISRMR